jgi:subtilisin family serine protease
MSLEELSREVVTLIRGNVPAPTRATVDRVLGNLKPRKVAEWGFGARDRHRRVVVQRLEAPTPATVLYELNTLPGVSVQRNMALAPAWAPDDPLQLDQWALAAMSAEAAWQCLKPVRPRSIVVAVVDSGISKPHPDLKQRTHPKSKRFTVDPPDGNILDEDGHGTYLAGTIAAVTDNALGVASATWPFKVRIIAHKFYDPWTPLTGVAAARAIVDAVDAGARVINASWHVGLQNDVLFEAVRYADQKDVLFVAAAGNEGTNNDQLPVWPACYNTGFGVANVVSVMATNRHDDKPGFSNYGRVSVDLAAPGSGVLSTHYYMKNPQYRAYGGTSAAAAHVTAAAALVRALKPAWSAATVKAHLIASVDARPYLDCVARGRLNLAAAVCGIV